MSIVVGTLILALFGVFYPTNSGNIYAACIALYALTSGLYFFLFFSLHYFLVTILCILSNNNAGFGGYVSAQKYKQFGGKDWLANILLVGLGLFAIPFACSFAFINGIAIHFEVTTALPFITILEVSSIWIFGMEPI